MKACLICNQHKTPCQAPAGLLQSLPVPHRPWSHIALDFVTDLPPSAGHTTILTVVDRVSKMADLIPLPKLPSAKETAELMLQHVFRLHGFHIRFLEGVLLSPGCYHQFIIGILSSVQWSG